jgi:hypothetical protein
VDDLELILRIVERREDVRLVYLFGSAARGAARTASDLDLAVLFTPVPEARALDQLTAELQAAARRRLDLVVLNIAPPLLAHEVIATGRLLVCRDEDERVRFEARAIGRYLDTGHLRKIQHAYLRERVDAHRARSS